MIPPPLPPGLGSPRGFVLRRGRIGIIGRRAGTAMRVGHVGLIGWLVGCLVSLTQDGRVERCVNGDVILWAV